MQWQFSSFEALGNADLYEILKARVDVFVVEQKCPYPEIDGYDRDSHHLSAWSKGTKTRQLAGYLRILPPGVKYPEPSLGRVITTRDFRGTGVGRVLFQRGIDELWKLYPAHPIRIQAQRYAEGFYSAFGFAQLSAPYDEDGISHIDMLLPPKEKIWTHQTKSSSSISVPRSRS